MESLEAPYRPGSRIVKEGMGKLAGPAVDDEMVRLEA
jgi:hypothetical protein